MKDRSQQTSKCDQTHIARMIFSNDEVVVSDATIHKLDHSVDVVGISLRNMLSPTYIEPQAVEYRLHNEVHQF